MLRKFCFSIAGVANTEEHLVIRRFLPCLEEGVANSSQLGGRNAGGIKNSNTGKTCLVQRPHPTLMAMRVAHAQSCLHSENPN